MRLSKEAAKATIIFLIDSEKLEVYQSNLYDHVMESAEWTTASVGNAQKLHIVDNHLYELREWNRYGGYRVIDTYEAITDAEEELFDKVYRLDFLRDDQRDTSYIDTKEEAESELEDRKKYINE
jgi:hypothetical protein